MGNWKRRMRIERIVKQVLKRKKPKFKVWRKTSSASPPSCKLTTWDVNEAVNRQLELQKAFPENLIYITGDYGK